MTRIEIDNLALAIAADLLNTGAPRQGTRVTIYCHEALIGERNRHSIEIIIAESIERHIRKRRAKTRKAGT